MKKIFFWKKLNECHDIIDYLIKIENQNEERIYKLELLKKKLLVIKHWYWLWKK